MLKRFCFITVVVLAALIGLLKIEVWAGVVINEVMPNAPTEATDEFIELYNVDSPGSGSVNVSGWTFSDATESDTIVAWSTRNPGTPIAGCDTTTTIIPVYGYAVILDPGYVGAGGIYAFPAGTTILTVESSATLGDGSGLLNAGEPITLFDDLGATQSTHADGWGPLAPGGDWSVERKNPEEADLECNWAVNSNSDSTPGAQNSVYNGGLPMAVFTADAASGTECHTFTFTDQSDSDGCQDVATWRWDYTNDGIFDDTGQGPFTHQYGFDGTYTVNLEIIDSGGDVADTTMTVTVTSADPVAKFAVDSNPDSECHLFVFTDTSDSDGCQDITNWLWNFGDGNTDTDSNTSHYYNTDTTCTVTLTVTDAGGDTSDTTMVITVTSDSPTAKFTVSPASASGTECLTVFSFTDDSDSDGCQDITNWLWEFGDGVTSTDSNTTHQYTDDGNYTCTLTVTDAGGDTSDTTMAITVNKAFPQAKFSVDSTSDSECHFFVFTDESDSDGCEDIDTWTWDFNGDGAIDASGQGPFFIQYPNDGVNTATLTVTDADGDTSDTTMIITVNKANPTAKFSVDSDSNSECHTFTFTDRSDSDGCENIVTWEWDFDSDGIVDALGQGPATYRFPDDGVCTVTLTVTDADGDTSDTTMVITANKATPTAAFSVDSNPDSECYTFQFNDESDSDGCEDIDTWTWDFGDGDTSTQQNPNHQFAGNGVYTVSLTVTDSGGDTTVATTNVTVNPVNPVAIFTVAASASGTECQTVFTFTDSSDSDGCQDITNWLWEFGDGATSTDSNTTYQYTDDGNYVCTLTVTDAGGDTSDTTIAITVISVNPTAQFNVDSTSGTECHTFTFTDRSDTDGCQALSWLWDFGDGDTSPAQDPTHIFPDDDTYTVRLTVTDQGGDTSDTTIQIVTTPFSPTANAGSDTTTNSKTVNFDGTGSTTDGCQSIDTYSWDFGDGNTGTGSTPSHTYTNPGTYIVTLTVTDSGGDTDSDTVTIKIVDQTSASLFGPGSLVAWQDYRNGNWDIYLYDLGPDGIKGTPGVDDDRGETQVTTDISHQQEPDVWVNTNDTSAVIVWTDYRNSTIADAYGDIYYRTFNPSTPTFTSGPIRVTTSTWHQAEPAVYDNMIVYATDQNGNGEKDIYYYDLNNPGAGVNPLVSNGGNQTNPDIYGDTVVYQSDEAYQNGDIWMINTNGGGTRKLLGGLRDQVNPAIDSADGRYVAYQSWNGTDWDIYVYDFNTGNTTPVATSANDEENPSVNNGMVAYQMTASPTNIYVYYIATGTTCQITFETDPAEAAKPSIYDPSAAYQRRGFPGDVWQIAFATLPDTAPPDSPTAVVESDNCTNPDLDHICSTGFSIHWTAPVDVSSCGCGYYEVEERIGAAGAWTQLGTTTGLCYPCTGRTQGSTYYYRVRAVGKTAGISEWAYSNGIMVDNTVPTVPGTPVEGDAVCGAGGDQDFDGDGTYDVYWSAASDSQSGVLEYQICEDTGAGTWTTCYTVTAPTTCRTITGKTGGTYYYRVRARNNALCNWTDWSTTSGGITVDTSPVPAPSAVVEGDTACQGGDEDHDLNGNYEVGWTAPAPTPVSGITAYRLEESTTGGAPWTVLGTVSGDSTCTSVTGRTHGTTYYYRIMAQNGAGNWSNYSPVSDGITVDMTAPPCLPATLEGGADTTASKTQLSAAWTPTADPEGTPIVSYMYAIGTDCGLADVLDWVTCDTNTTNTTCTGLNLTNGRTYNFSVRQQNSLGQWSSNCCDDITVSLNEWIISIPASGSSTDHCTAGVNIAGSDNFDTGLDGIEPPFGPSDSPTHVVVFFPHPEYPDTTTRNLETDIREKDVPLDTTCETWTINLWQNFNTPGHIINLNKPNLVDVPVQLDVMVRDEDAVPPQIVYLYLNGVDQGASDPIFTFDANWGPLRRYTLIVAGQNATPTEPAWIAERMDRFPTSGAEDQDCDSDGIFYVAWQNVGAPATQYELQQDSGAGWVTVQINAWTTYTLTTGVHNTTYEHRVRAIADCGYSNWTTAATIIVDMTDPPIPGKPYTIPSGYSVTGNYTVCWAGVHDPESGVTGYELQESPVSPVGWNTILTTALTCYDTTGHDTGEYIYRVRSINCATRPSDWSDTSNSITVDNTGPTVPTNVIEGDNSCAGIDSDHDADGNYNISWTAPGGAPVAYEIKEGKAGVAGWTTLSSTFAATCYSITNKDSGTYYYRVRAKDAANNWGDWSDTSDGISVADTARCHDFPAGWSLISIPVDPTYPEPEETFGCLSYGTCWLLGYQTNVGYHNDYSLSLGEGYWLGLNEAANICVLGTPLLADAGATYSIPLKAGWNLIGCPYPTDLTTGFTIEDTTGAQKTLVQARDAGWIPMANFYEYDHATSNYMPVTTLSPFEGYWFASSIEGELVIANITEPAPLAWSSPSLVNKGDLLLEITASSGGIMAVGGIGLASSCDDDLDPQDRLLPPDPEGDYISFYTNHPEAGDFSRFSRDIRRSPGLRQTKEFEFVVATNITDSKMTLSWDPSQIKGYRAVLTDGAQKIDMKRESSYSYNSSSGQKTFAVELTEKESVPSQNTLLQNFPNPFNPECWIPFKLSEPANHVEFRIYTITGQLIRTIDCGPRDDSDHVTKCGDAASNRTNGCACYWDGHNNRGDEVASGVYFYQLVADGKVLTKKMVVLK